jgi:DNA-binding CsgD family transcriptional regulator
MGGMTAERVRAQIDGLAAAGLDWETFGRTALEVLRQGMPFASACLATMDPATHIVTSTVKTGNLDDDHDAAWAFHEYAVEDVYDFRTLSAGGTRVVGLASATDGDVARSRRYTELFSPVWDYTDELRAPLRVDDATWGGLALFHEGARTFTAAEQEFVASVTGAFARGLRAGIVTGMAAVGDTVGPAGPAVLVVGTGGEIVQANVGAGARLAELGCDLGTGPLPQVVGSLVAAAQRSATLPGAANPRARLRTRDGRWVAAHASLLVDASGAGRTVVVTLDDARPPEIVPLVVSAYGLTGRERDVVTLVLQGVDTADIARSLHLSAYTVQDHLKRVFAKVGVRSRRELIARIVSDLYVPRITDDAALAPSGWFAPTA